MKTHAYRVAWLMAVVTAFYTGQALAGQKALQLLPDAPGPETARIADRPLKSNEYFVYGTPVDGTHTVIVGGKGSLAVGLLFGPLGVAANAAHAQSVNAERGKGIDTLTHVDAVAALQAARPAAQSAADARAYELMPIVMVRFEDDKVFHVNCMLTASLKNPGKRDWHARYWVEMPGSYDTSSPVAIDAAAQAVAPCLAETNRLFEGHVKGGMQPGETAQPVIVNGKAVSLKLVDAEYPARYIVPDVIGIMEWPAPVAVKPETGDAGGG